MQLSLEAIKIGLASKDECSLERSLLSGALSTAYCCPFTEGNELGKLDEHYEKFQNPDFADAHKSLFDYRNKFFCHRDIPNALMYESGKVAKYIGPL